MSENKDQQVKGKARPKPGRRPESTLEPYAKELIRNAGATKRCEDSQECAKELLGLFIKVVRKYDEPLFWISTQEDTFSSTGLFPEDKYKQESMSRYTFFIKNIRGSSDTRKILGTQVSFERAEYPKHFALPPICTIPITEILNRLIINDPENSIYFLNKNAYGEYIEGAKEIIEKHTYNTEANRLIRDNYNSIVNDLKNKPEKFDVKTMHKYWAEEGRKASITVSPFDRASSKGIGSRAAAENLISEARREERILLEPGPTFTI